MPENPEAVKNLHTDIDVVRMPRQAQKRIQYAYLEFNSETKCEEAKVMGLNSALYSEEGGGEGKFFKRRGSQVTFLTGTVT